MAQKLMPKLDFPAGWRGGPSPPIMAEELAELAPRLLHDPELSPRDRVASVLVAVFAQPVSRVARLTADDAELNGESVAICFGDTAVSMPDPIADDLRDTQWAQIAGRPWGDYPALLAEQGSRQHCQPE